MAAEHDVLEREGLERAVADHPDDADAWRALARALHDEGRFDEAAEAFERVQKLDDSAMSRRDIGVTLIHGGRPADAARVLGEAVAAFPDDAETLKVYGVALNQEGRHQEAEDVLRRAVAQNDTDPVSHSALGETLAAIGRPLDAVAELQTSLDLDPAYTPARHRLATTYRSLGRLDEAAAELEKVVAQTPQEASARAALGLVETDRGHLPEALQRYREATGLEPANVDHLVLLGGALEQLGRHDEAAGTYRAALALDDRREDVHCALGDVLAAEANAAESDPGVPDAERRRRWEEAADAYRAAVALVGTTRAPHAALAFCLDKLGRKEEAVDEYRQAVRLPVDPSIPGYREELDVVSLAEILRQLGRPEEAEEALGELLAGQPDVRLVHRARAWALRDLCRWDDALAALDVAMRCPRQSLVGVEGQGPELDPYLKGDILLLNLQRAGDAIEAYGAAIQMRTAAGGQYPEAHNQRAVALLWTRRPEEAVEDARCALAAGDAWANGDDRWNAHETLGAGYLMLSERYRDKTLLVDAIAALADALRHFPRHRREEQRAEEAAVYLRRGYAFAGRGQVVDAMADLRKCRDLASEWSQADFWAAYYLRRLEQRSIQAVPTFVPHLVAAAALGVLVLAGVLTATRTLTGVAFTGLSTAMLATVMIAYSLPVITKLRFGGAEFEKTASVTEVQPLPPPPLTLTDEPAKTATVRARDAAASRVDSPTELPSAIERSGP